MPVAKPVTALVVVLAAVACGGQRPGVTTVRRAPAVSLLGVPAGARIGLRVRARCTDVVLGPDEVFRSGDHPAPAFAGPRVIFSGGHSPAQPSPREQRRSCAGSTLEAQVVQGLTATVRGLLLPQGFTVADGPTGVHDLVVDLDILRRRVAVRERGLADGPGETSCARLCGAPTCEWSHVDGGVRILARLSGPRASAGKAPAALRLFSGSSVRRGRKLDSGYRVLTCGVADRREHLRTTVHDWDGAVIDVLARARGGLRRLLSPYVEVERRLGEYERM